MSPTLHLLAGCRDLGRPRWRGSSKRLARRNLDLTPGTFNISADEFDEWEALFEPPTPEESASP